MTVKESLVWAKAELTAANTTEPEASALILLAEILGLSRSEVLAKSERPLSKTELAKYKQFIGRRKKHESVWHILGYVIFWGLELEVSRDVLVPRPETEMLVENVVNYVLGAGGRIKNILDVGTGSGAIALALAEEFPDLEIVAVDISEAALKVAQKNAKLNKITTVQFKKSDLLGGVTGRYDVITANLPYIPTVDMKSLPKDVFNFEPHLALDGGSDGLKLFERLFEAALDHLNPGGRIYCEIGINQGESLEVLAQKYLPNAKTTILKDFAGIDRIGIIELSNK